MHAVYQGLDGSCFDKACRLLAINLPTMKDYLPMYLSRSAFCCTCRPVAASPRSALPPLMCQRHASLHACVSVCACFRIWHLEGNAALHENVWTIPMFLHEIYQ